MANIQIRQGEARDIQKVYDLVRLLAVFEKAEDQVSTTVDYYREEFDKGTFQFLIAEKNNELAGMALYYTAFSTWKGKMLYLEDFVVKPEMRSHGIGQGLFDKLLKLAKEQDYKLMKWQVLDWNEGAVKFYMRNSAVIQKNWWNGVIYFD